MHGESFEVQGTVRCMRRTRRIHAVLKPPGAGAARQQVATSGPWGPYQRSYKVVVLNSQVGGEFKLCFGPQNQTASKPDIVRTAHSSNEEGVKFARQFVIVVGRAQQRSISVCWRNGKIEN